MDATERTDAYPQGKKLGVDVGTVRVGVAICDPDGILATPFKTVQRDAKKNSDVRLIVRHTAEEGIVQIFVGLPRTMRGEEHASARMATEYAGLLAAELLRAGMDVPVHMVDERLTTVSAHRSLHEAGMGSRDHRTVVDQVAAAGILQQAIDMQKSRRADVGSRVHAAADTGQRGESGATARAADHGTDQTPTRGSQQ